MAGNQPINQLYILRFLGALVVVTHHYGKHLLGETGIFAQLVHNAGFILSFFFALSGFVIGYNYFTPERFSKPKFLLKRLARLFPLYLLAFGLTLISGMLLNDAYPQGLTIILQALCLHAWYPSKVLAINYPSWSVSVEFFFYLIFPWLVLRLGKLSFRWFMIVTLAIWVLSSTQHVLFEQFIYDQHAKWTSEFILYFPIWHLNAFLAGMAGAEIFKRIRTKQWPTWIPPLFGLLCAASLILVTGTENAIRPHIHNGLLSPIILIMLVGFSLDTSILAKFMSSRPLVYLGNLTYGIYILQHPVFLWTSKAMDVNQFSPLQFLTYVMILLIASIAAYHLFEEPCRKWIVKRGMSQLKTA